MEEKLQRSSAELAESIAAMTSELNELKRRKRAFNAEINAQIKDLEGMIEAENDQWRKMRANEGLPVG